MRSKRSLNTFGSIGAGSLAFSRKFASSDDDADSNIPSLVQQIMGSNSAQTFDGFRCIVQKQVNLNTTVSHFYWLGSQSVPPMYKYYLIFHDEDKMISVNTDMDMNVEGEVKYPISPTTNSKFNFTLSDQVKAGNAYIGVTGDTYTAQFEIAQAPTTTLGVSYMQAVYPNISLGGSGKWLVPKSAVSNSFGGMYDDGEHVVCASWDNQLQIMYLRRVNRNRVHLCSQLTVDEALKGQASASAEFTLKQSKLNFTVDSELLVKSSLETSVMAGMVLQVAAEAQHASNHYRFGYGIMIGGS